MKFFKPQKNNPLAVTPKFGDFCKEDQAELEQMILALYQEDPPGQEMTPQKIRLTVRELSSNPVKGVITIFCIDEAVVGYAIIIFYWSNEFGGNIASIDEFYVKPPWRGKGIGTNFLEHLASIKVGNLKGLQVEVTPANEKAFAYYSRNGFSTKADRYMFKNL